MGVSAPANLVGGATSKVAYVYEDAEFGGTFVHKAYSPDFMEEAEIRLLVG